PLFGLSTRLRRSSTPFPYTTLFRSLQRRRAVPHAQPLAAEHLVRHREVLIPDRVLRRHTARTRHGRVRLTPRRRLRRVVILVGRDRKSTRLNSSHVKISYAVFCLKK